jgi:hypothetical protein
MSFEHFHSLNADDRGDLLESAGYYGYKDEFVAGYKDWKKRNNIPDTIIAEENKVQQTPSKPQQAVEYTSLLTPGTMATINSAKQKRLTSQSDIDDAADRRSYMRNYLNAGKINSPNASDDHVVEMTARSSAARGNQRITLSGYQRRNDFYDAFWKQWREDNPDLPDVDEYLANLRTPYSGKGFYNRENLTPSSVPKMQSIELSSLDDSANADDNENESKSNVYENESKQNLIPDGAANEQQRMFEPLDIGNPNDYVSGEFFNFNDDENAQTTAVDKLVGQKFTGEPPS